MRVVCEHIYEEMGDFSENFEMAEMLEELESECRKVNVYSYFNDIVTVYVESAKKYYVFNTSVLEDCVNEDEMDFNEECNAYITEFDNKEDVIYYLIDNTYAEDYGYLDKVI